MTAGGGDFFLPFLGGMLLFVMTCRLLNVDKKAAKIWVENIFTGTRDSIKFTFFLSVIFLLCHFNRCLH